MAILIGLLIAGIGFILVWKSEWFYENFGTIAWAEEHLGTEGGSRMMYKLIGIVGIAIGFMTITGILGDLGRSLVPHFFGGLSH